MSFLCVGCLQALPKEVPDGVERRRRQQQQNGLAFSQKRHYGRRSRSPTAAAAPRDRDRGSDRTGQDAGRAGKHRRAARLPQPPFPTPHPCQRSVSLTSSLNTIFNLYTVYQARGRPIAYFAYVCELPTLPLYFYRIVRVYLRSLRIRIAKASAPAPTSALIYQNYTLRFARGPQFHRRAAL